MMKKAKPILAATLLLSLSFSLLACASEENPKNEKEDTTISQNEQDWEPAPAPDDTSKVKPDTDAGLTKLEKAAKAFPDVKGNDFTTKEEFQLALYSAETYLHNIMNDPYVQNGSWVRDGASYAYLADRYGNYWSDDFGVSVEETIQEVLVDSTAERKMFTIMYYFVDNDKIAITDTCAAATISPSTLSCLENGQVQLNDKWTYNTAEDGRIIADIRFSINVLTSVDGVEGIQPVRYEWKLMMSPNDGSDNNSSEEDSIMSYEVDGLEGSYEVKPWEPIN